MEVVLVDRFKVSSASEISFAAAAVQDYGIGVHAGCGWEQTFGKRHRSAAYLFL